MKKNILQLKFMNKEKILQAFWCQWEKQGKKFYENAVRSYPTSGEVSYISLRSEAINILYKKSWILGKQKLISYDKIYHYNVFLTDGKNKWSFTVYENQEPELFEQIRDRIAAEKEKQEQLKEEALNKLIC